MRDRDPREDRERLVVQDVALGVEQPAVAVIRVLAEADVGQHDELRARCLQGSDRLLDHAVLGMALGAELVLLGGDAEEKHGLDAESVELARLGGKGVDGELRNPGHRRDRLAHALARADEERVYEVAGVERRLANEIAERTSAAPAARPLGSRPDLHALDWIRLDVVRHPRSPKWDTRA